MSLPARQRRVLGRMESTLHGSDPRLAALYAIFARLTRDEEMPRMEQLRHSTWLVVTQLRSGVGSFLVRVLRRVVPRPRAAIVFPMALALAAASIVIAALATPRPACTPTSPLAAGPKEPAKHKQCKAPPMPAMLGHLAACGALA